MTNTPLVSIIIPAFNVADCIKECLDSTISQDYDNYEVLIVDDGSTDGTLEICRNYAKKYSHVRVISKINKGVNFARRDGFSASKGALVAFLDADDVIGKQFISHLVEMINKTSSDLAVCKTHRFYANKLSENEINQCRIVGFELDHQTLNDKKTILSSYITGQPPHSNMPLMSMWGKLYKRQLLNEVDWNIANYRYAEDYFINAQYFSLTTKICFVNEYLHYYRKNRVGKLSAASTYNISPSGKKIDYATHVTDLVRLYKKISVDLKVALDKEIDIFQCRLYGYWIEKLAKSNQIDEAFWSKYRNIILKISERVLSKEYHSFMKDNIFSGENLFNSLKNTLRLIRKYKSLDCYKKYAADLMIKHDTHNDGVDYRDAWVIMDRPDSATDNGYHFYKWLFEKHPEINSFFLINRDSADAHKLRRQGFHLVYCGSDEHRRLLDECKVEIYAYYTFNICEGRKNFDSLKVYLGHGIHKDDSLNPGLASTDLFVTSLRPEYDYYVKNHKDDFRPVLTGIPRYSRLLSLKNTRRRIIVIAPTWRKWLTSSNINDSDYYRCWKCIIDSKEIRKISTKYETIFIPHPELRKINSKFHMPNHIKTVCYEELGAEDIQELMKKTLLFVTDYSSVAFDYALAGSKIVYFQFDQKCFYEQHTVRKAWFDYEVDGFGPTCKNVDELRYLLREYLPAKSNNEKYAKKLKKMIDYSLIKNSNINIYNRIVAALRESS
jgi:glycosyltransferase involved in cell wall biosynthesis